MTGVTCLFLISIYIYIYSPFYFRFVSRHNTNHRANGEATAHSNQAFGAFWSRVTPPELLYIWLLSFDELRLAMNAHLPVVRPLLCYARRGATPMHQKVVIEGCGIIIHKRRMLCLYAESGYCKAGVQVG